MAEAPNTTWGWLYHAFNTLGIPVGLILLVWFRLLEPAAQKHFDQMDQTQKTQAIQTELLKKQVDIDRQQTELLSQIRSSQSEEIIRSREQVGLLKDIKGQRNGMN